TAAASSPMPASSPSGPWNAPCGSSPNWPNGSPIRAPPSSVSPDSDNPLASPSTLARFQYAYTRRQAQLPVQQPPVLLAVRAPQTGRIKILNQYLVELFIRTRRTPPAAIVLAVDATDDPVHGRQTLSGYHGSYRQHQYLPLFVYDGGTGFPLA